MKSTLAKVLYVAAVTTFCTFLGCWALLAHQASQQTTVSAVRDERFAKKAAQGALAEVKLGKLAQDKGTNEAVKKFGQRMVEDHSKANDELKRAATKENITLPGDVDKKDQDTYDALANLSGAAFDKAYARDMVKGHQEDIAEFQREANGGQKDAIKSFAAETLPTLRDRLQEAREMRQAVASSKVTQAKNTSSGHAGPR